MLCKKCRKNSVSFKDGICNTCRTSGSTVSHVDYSYSADYSHYDSGSTHNHTDNNHNGYCDTCDSSCDSGGGCD